MTHRYGRKTIVVTMSVLLLTALAFAPPAGARTTGVHFEETHMAGGVDLVLKGDALLYYLVFIKAYSGAFYLPRDVPGGEALSDVPKRLVLEYHQSIDGEDFSNATLECIKRNVGKDTFSALASRVARLNALYRDVGPGDRYSLTYLPGYGTELALNGKALGVIPGADFAQAVFSIWIGRVPIDEGFKEKLLGMR